MTPASRIRLSSRKSAALSIFLFLLTGIAIVYLGLYTKREPIGGPAIQAAPKPLTEQERAALETQLQSDRALLMQLKQIEQQLRSQYFDLQRIKGDRTTPLAKKMELEAAEPANREQGRRVLEQIEVVTKRVKQLESTLNK